MTNISKTNKSTKGGKVKMETSDKEKLTSGKKTVTKKTESKSSKMKLPFIRKVHIKPVYFVLGAVVTILAVFFLRVAIWEHNYLKAMEGSERDVATVGVSNEGGESDEEIDETEPTEQERIDWCTVVAPDRPCSFSIPYLSIYGARIVEIGVKGQGEMATPYNIYDVGWYTGDGSVVPGQSGVTVMNAHGGDLGYGIFRSLPKLPVGQEIQVKLGNGTVYRYRVVESVRKALGDEANNYMTTAFTPLSGTRNTLSLITCTGDWWESQQTYSERLFVRAELIQ